MPLCVAQASASGWNRKSPRTDVLGAQLSGTGGKGVDQSDDPICPGARVEGHGLRVRDSIDVSSVGDLYLHSRPLRCVCQVQDLVIIPLHQL